MQFGMTIKPDMTVERIIALTRQAEETGFEYGWIFDSHVLWLEPYPLLTLMAANTSAPSRRCAKLMSGAEIDYDGQPTRLTWARVTPPIWVAGYGPKVLDMAGRVGDGVILQFADPDLIEWCLSFVKKGAQAVGRDYRKIEVMAASAVWMSNDLEKARKQVRWFPALVSNHVIDLLSRYKPEELPPALTSYVSNRGAYDYLQHCEVDSKNSKFVTDDIVDRFCLVGPAEAHREKLRRLAKIGVTQFNLYLMSGDEEQTLEDYKREILPAMKGANV